MLKTFKVKCCEMLKHIGVFHFWCPVPATVKGFALHTLGEWEQRGVLQMWLLHWLVNAARSSVS